MRAQEKMKWKAMGTKMPMKRKRDQKTIIYIISDWSMCNHLRQGHNLLNLLLALQRLCVYNDLLNNNGSVLKLVVAFTMMPPSVIIVVLFFKKFKLYMLLY